MLLSEFKNLKFCYQKKSMHILHDVPGCLWAVCLAVIQGGCRCAPDSSLFYCPGGSRWRSHYSASWEQNGLRYRETGPYSRGRTLGWGRCMALLQHAAHTDSVGTPKDGSHQLLPAWNLHYKMQLSASVDSKTISEPILSLLGNAMHLPSIMKIIKTQNSLMF